ncbi:UDP-N-acetylglucosamine 2-epimerase (non-hydrolyzing) [Lactobacillus alvi]|uniref:UDP-N-acetylglucosamine 2-epimerase (non-hydrolyzing) n=1 Tax=Limosilactobacillus alvi TaxID=990412 RepID=A0ABS2EMJ4_9LACO|nr:UDP-N-acetylglucosamine 2-epimerase (non-hydrolyzing) [Limosilactobacillus alvi]MBM6753291.1 UDP-N-acetylglucosamine 2-epimerase (non-hydrolyzing) [Limosilactobacillus alvi]
MANLKVMIPLSTRAGVIKFAPVIKAMQADQVNFEPVIVVASQKYQQLHAVLNYFGLKPDFELNVDPVNERGKLDELSRLLHNLQTVVNAAQPDIMLTLGDTIVTLAASLSAFYCHLPVAHIEAGLRTFDKHEPFPDEMHRQLTDALTDLYFAPTEAAKENLLFEHQEETQIVVTGNPIVDVVQDEYDPKYASALLAGLPDHCRIILLTMGRIENTGLPMERVLRTMRDIVETNPDVELICPLPLDSQSFSLAEQLLANHQRIHLMPLMTLGDFINTAARSYLILTDSAGTVEEATVFHRPVLLLRQNTERPEALFAQTTKIVGTDPTSIQQAMFDLLNDKHLYRTMVSESADIFGDGHAAERIVAELKKRFIK